jgi:ribonuclease HI
MSHFVSPYYLPPIPHHVAAANRRFDPPVPTATPQDLFEVKVNQCSNPAPRYIRKSNPREMLIYIDGSCLNNGTAEARAGYGIKWSPRTCNILSARLEGTGPETSNRAELRAAVIAVSLRAWHGEGFHTVVLACNSEYVVLGISERIQNWIQRGWRTAAGSPVENRDLWERLLDKLDIQNKYGVMIKFWRIPRESNAEADALAREGALKSRATFMHDVLLANDF